MLLSTVELHSSIVVRIDIALRLDFPLSRARIRISLLSRYLKTDRFRFLATEKPILQDVVHLGFR